MKKKEEHDTDTYEEQGYIHISPADLSEAVQNFKRKLEEAECHPVIFGSLGRYEE